MTHIIAVGAVLRIVFISAVHGQRLKNYNKSIFSACNFNRERILCKVNATKNKIV